ncbi:MAG: extracellular solute-binding protein [Clostridiales bacterium]|nr:extracellular solute-binding protein [Clostridiales bacterium]
MNKTRLTKGVMMALLAAALVFLLPVQTMGGSPPSPGQVSAAIQELRAIYMALPDVDSAGYEHYLAQNKAPAYTGEALDFAPEGGETFLSETAGGSAVFRVTAPQDALYALRLDYVPQGRQILPTVLKARLDGARPYPAWDALRADNVWAFDGFPLDRYGNQTVGMPRRVNQAQSMYFRENTGRYSQPLLVRLTEGEHEISLHSAGGELSVTGLWLAAPPTMEAPRETRDTAGTNLIVIEAERMDRRNNPNVRSGAAYNSALSPYSANKKVQNFIEDASFRYGGARVEYDITVPEDGWYRLIFHYRQLQKDGFTVFRNLTIDGEIPHAGLSDIPFSYARQFTRQTLPEAVYLTKGLHSLGLEVSLDPTRYAVLILEEVIGGMNDLTLAITRIVGGNTDRYRDFNLLDYGIDAGASLSSWADTLEGTHAALDRLKSVSGTCGEIEQLNVAAKLLRLLSEEPNELPKRLNEFSRGITTTGAVASSGNANSALQYLVNTLESLQTSELGLDSILLFQDGARLPRQKGLLETLGDGLAHFMASFGTQEYTADYGKQSGDTLQIWVGRPRQYLEIMQNLADTRFTPQTGIKVDLSIVPDQSKLILANASGKAPDAAIAVASGSVYDLAIRGALKDMRGFDSFKEVASRFAPGMLIPGVLDEGLYAIPETFNFWVMFYRSDILSSLGLEVPDSLQEVRAMLPQLRRLGMNFNSQVSNFVAKPFAATAPFLLQSGASVYDSASGLSALNSAEAIEAMTLMAENYTVYSMQYNISSFYQYFRDGRTPLGVSDYGTFNLLTNAAPELAGKWELALYPGIADENGVVQRWTSGAAESNIIFSSSQRQDAAWAFLDWWMSTEIQTDFSFLLQTTLGNEYMWNSANLEALENAAWNPKHKAVIIEQLQWTRELPRVPGGYMAEREISNALDAVINGKKLQSAIDAADRNINREIKRKMEEFGYTADGEPLKPFVLPSLEMVEGWLQ